LSRLTRHARNRFRRAPTGGTIAKKKEGQETPGHSDSPRFDFPGVILLKNPSGTGNEAIGQQYWARIIVFAGTFPSTPRFCQKAASPPPARAWTKHSKYPVRRLGSLVKGDALCVLGFYHRRPDHAPLISAASLIGAALADR
jgi:hypothetical protein